MNGNLGANAAFPVIDLLTCQPTALCSDAWSCPSYTHFSRFTKFGHRNNLTPRGGQRWELYPELKAGLSVVLSLFSGIRILQQ